MTQIRIPSHRISFTQQQRIEIGVEIQRVLESGNVVLGEYTRQFEEMYAEKVGRENGVAVSSDTAAFEIQLRAMEWPEGSYVLFPALGFGSILESIHNAGLRPWFVDANIETGLFATADRVLEAIRQCERKTGLSPLGLILMHTGGLLATESNEIEKICAEEGVVVLEDAAHAYGATLDGRPAGTWGLSSAFSLYATKPMHAMEGGMLLTDDWFLAEEVRTYRNYGRTADFGRSTIVRHGSSWRMTEIQAIVGISNLKSMDDKLACRRMLMELYDKLISQDKRFWGRASRLKYPSNLRPNGYRYLMMMHDPALCYDGWREQVKKSLSDDHGIDLPGEVYELPAHLQPVWKEEYEELQGRMPQAEDFCARHFALPLYETLTESDVDYVVDAVGSVLEALDDRG